MEYTLGILPSNKNAGLIAQIPVLIGEGDSRHAKIMLINKSNPRYENEKKDYIKLEDSQYYKALSKEYKEKFRGYDFYISKKSMKITKETASYQNSINGMMNSEAEAIKNGLEQTGQFVKNKPVELMVHYNPTNGFLGDLLESLVNKLGGTTGIAKQTGEAIKKVTTQRGKEGSNFALHSQGNLIAYSGIKNVLEQKDGFKNKKYFFTGKIDKNNQKEYAIATFVSYGSPINTDDMDDLINKELKYDYIGSFTKKDDAVGEILGGNSGNNEKATLIQRVNILNLYKLFTEDSPHSSYICRNYEKEGVICGYKK